MKYIKRFFVKTNDNIYFVLKKIFKSNKARHHITSPWSGPCGYEQVVVVNLLPARCEHLLGLRIQVDHVGT